MRDIDVRDLDEKHLEAYQRRLALVETLLDDAIDEGDRQRLRRRFCQEHGVSDRTIRNYLRRYREKGAWGDRKSVV